MVAVCLDCHGTGKSTCSVCFGERTVECYDCRGTGWVDEYPDDCTTVEVQCDECFGNGHVECMDCDEHGLAKCRTCQGAGIIDSAFRKPEWWNDDKQTLLSPQGLMKLEAA